MRYLTPFGIVGGYRKKITLSMLLIITLLSLLGTAAYARGLLAQLINLAPGETATIVCDGEHLHILSQTAQQIEVVCENHQDPPPEPTNTPPPAPTNTPEPPTPTPPGPPNVFSPYGIYPDCIAPAIGVESQGWWHQPGEEVPRHVHMAACVPNARDMTGELLAVSGDLQIVQRVVLFNNPAEFRWAGIGYEEKSGEVRDCPGGGVNCVVFDQPLRCQDKPDEKKLCTWYVEQILPTRFSAHAGLVEVRMKPNLIDPELDTRQFTTLNFQVYIRDGRPESNYRNSPAPIARGWYTDFGYANTSLKNYTDLFGGDMGSSIPTVSGVVPLHIRHSKGDHTLRSILLLDPRFHEGDEGTVLYDKPGRFYDTYNWDTHGLTNGTHTLVLMTVDDGGNQGVNRGMLKLLFNVQN